MLPENTQSSIVPFSYEGTQIRIIRNENGDLWFVAADVCKVLEYGNPTQTLNRLDDDEVTLISNEGRPINIISESGLYALILGSRKAEAKTFKRWVTHEVLPTIRKTGQFSVRPLSPAEQNLANAQLLLDHERRLVSQEATVTAHNIRIAALENSVANKIGGNEYYSILGYMRHHHGVPVPSEAKMSAIGKKCAALSRERNLFIGKVSDPRHGDVGTYHESIIAEVLS